MSQVYIFDFDGTLVDSMPTYAAVMLRVARENGIDGGAELVKIITPLGYRGTAEYFRAHGAPRSTEELLAAMQGYIRVEYEKRIGEKAGVSETLQTLRAQGASLNVLTASPHATLDPCLKRLGLYDLFDHVWSCEDFSTTKADPHIYQMAAERIGKPIGEILFLDDNYNADKTAASAGMRVCGVYDPSSEEYAEEIKRVSDHYIKDFCELLDL
jgi:HAD superfamily hydrolase (TIGR01509 family)